QPRPPPPPRYPPSLHDALPIFGQGRAGVGIALQPKYDYPFKVRIDAGDVGGPSAGMMFALGVRDTLTPGPMTGGKSSGGPGTIDDEGSGGPGGGIQQKMIGGQERGARWILPHPPDRRGDAG